MTLVRVFLVALFAVCLTASAQEAQISQSSIYSEVTSNTRLEKALDTLTGTSGEWAQKAILGSNLSKKPIKIEFRDLSKISILKFLFPLQNLIPFITNVFSIFIIHFWLILNTN